VEIINLKEYSSHLPVEHKLLLDERLKRVEVGMTTLKNWNLVIRKYEKKAI